MCLQTTSSIFMKDITQTGEASQKEEVWCIYSVYIWLLGVSFGGCNTSLHTRLSLHCPLCPFSMPSYVVPCSVHSLHYTSPLPFSLSSLSPILLPSSSSLHVPASQQYSGGWKRRATIGEPAVEISPTKQHASKIQAHSNLIRSWESCYENLHWTRKKIRQVVSF